MLLAARSAWCANANAARATYGEIITWDVSRVTDMSYMFSSAYKFNDDISNWNVGQVQQMHSMFNYASIFNADITGWKPKTECTDAERNSGN